MGMPLSTPASAATVEDLRRATLSAITRTVLLGLPELRKQRDATRAAGFLLLAVDVVYDDEAMVPWVLEVNTNGYLGAGLLEVSRALGVDILQDMFRLAGAAGFDRSGYQERLEAMVEGRLREQPVVPSSARTELIRRVQAAVDELTHRGSWEPAYPWPQRETDGAVESLARLQDGLRDKSADDLAREIALLGGTGSVL